MAIEREPVRHCYECNIKHKFDTGTKANKGCIQSLRQRVEELEDKLYELTRKVYNE